VIVGCRSLRDRFGIAWPNCVVLPSNHRSMRVSAISVQRYAWLLMCADSPTSWPLLREHCQRAFENTYPVAAAVRCNRTRHPAPEPRCRTPGVTVGSICVLFDFLRASVAIVVEHRPPHLPGWTKFPTNPHALTCSSEGYGHVCFSIMATTTPAIAVELRMESIRSCDYVFWQKATLYSR
jgi:hypothetical protein